MILILDDFKKERIKEEIMKAFKHLLAVILTVVLMLTFASCYTISGQKMRTVKGTYQLTHYTYTPKYERKEGYTPRTFNYLEDEEYQYEDYLIITGSGTGYYVHKEAGSDAYVKEVTLSYEYDDENSSKVEYVIFNDALTVNKNSEFNKMGVTKNSLNYTKTSFDYNELFTKRPMRSEALMVRWTKVSSDTDLKYVEQELGELKKYDYNAFGKKGIYQRNAPWDIETGVVQDSPYQYFYYVIDTAENTLKATAYYALKETPGEKVVREYQIERISDDWSILVIDGVEWTLEQPYSTNYYNDTDGMRTTLSRVSSDISDKRLNELIDMWLPVGQ